MTAHSFESPAAAPTPSHFDPARPPAPPRATGEPPPDPAPEELEETTPGAVLDALLRSPGRLLAALGEGRAWGATTLVTLASLALTGLALATWSGGPQLAIVPLKLIALTGVTALVCWPSLHVLTALGGGAQPVRETASALAMGMALAAVLGLALAPIAWVLSAATSSLALAGTLYLVVFLVAASLGLGLVRRALRAGSSAPLRGLGAWSFLFVMVALQLATTLRPLVGPFEGLWPEPRTFFLEHLFDCLGR
ncbi:MAG: hypothetical protein U0234_27405 [Sandaracinus sp.]